MRLAEEGGADYIDGGDGNERLIMIRLFLFFMISVMAAGGTSMAENVSTCPVDMVPIQIIQLRKHGPVTTLSAADLDYSTPVYKKFSLFVRDVTEHLAAKLAQENFCLNNVASRERSLIQFMPWYINTGPGPLSSVPPLGARSSGVCRISSPWVDIVIEQRPVPYVRGIVRWNERQLLADQAVLAEVRNVPLGVAVPLTYEEFEKYAEEYKHSEIQHQPAKKPIEDRVPPDLLWLFRHAWQQNSYSSFSGPASGSMRKAMERGAEGYTKIVIALIDHCFASGGVDIQYNSILDVADLVQLEQYKIVTPIIVMPVR